MTRRSETTVAALERGHRLERWRRVALASAKQCGRAVVPEVLEAQAFASDAGWFDALALPAPRLLLVEPDARAGRPTPAADVPRPGQSRATLIVGPEGGWAPDEIEALEASCLAVTLGPRTLRADAAAVVAMAALFAVWRVDEEGAC